MTSLGDSEKGVVLPALLSAILLFLAQPPFTYQPLPFLALVPLAVGLRRLPPGPLGRRRATLLGLLFGLAFWGLSLVWVPLVVGPFFSWAYPGYGLLLVVLGGLSALLGWIVHRLEKGSGVPLALALPLAWVGVEWLKVHFPFGLSFPWLGLGVTLTGQPELLGLAEWTGEGGVAFWLAGVNGLVAWGVLSLGKKTPGERSLAKTLPWLMAGLAVALPSGVGILRARTLPLSPGPMVAVVGTQVPRELRGSPGPSTDQALDQVVRALGQGGLMPQQVAGAGAGARDITDSGPPALDLVLFPEATVPLPLGGGEARLYREALGGMASALGSSLLVGALGQDPAEGGETGLTNSAYLLSPEGGPVQRYDKARLVPAMEGGAYRRGPGGEVVTAEGWRYGPLLCYESLFGGLARRARLNGAEVLVNLSSDIWFGEGTSGIGALFLYQHPAHLVMRAVENRMPVARAANGGWSLFLDPVGRKVGQPVAPEGGLALGRLPVWNGLTLFSRTGDLVGPASLLLCLVLMGLGRSRRAEPMMSDP